MLMNNLDPEVAEHPEDLVVYGGTGKAARSWEAFDAIVRTLDELEPDETLLVQSGKPVGVFRTHEWAPRVLIANSNLVGDWATWPEFRRLGAARPHDVRPDDRRILDLHRHAGHPAGHVRDVRRRRRSRSGATRLAGTLTLTGGCGGMGGAQPLAVTMNGGAVLIVDVDESRLARRVEHGYLDEYTTDLDAAIDACRRGEEGGRARSRSESSATPPRSSATCSLRGVPIDIVTDQTSAHDPLAYLPVGIAIEDWRAEADRDPEGFTARARGSMAKQVAAMVGFQDAGAAVFDYGNSIRREAELGGFARAFEFPGFVPAYIRPLFAEGKGPFRWVALSGDPEDIAKTDRAVKELFPEDAALHRWLDQAAEKVHFEGLPARICWLGYKERHLAGLKFNEMVASGELSAPIVIGRDHLDSGSVASPVPRDRGDGRRLRRDRGLAAAERAAQHRRAARRGSRSTTAAASASAAAIHAGQVTVADGTALAAEKLERVLTNDPGTGVMRHVDAGYERAKEVARERGLKMPML